MFERGDIAIEGNDFYLFISSIRIRDIKKGNEFDQPQGGQGLRPYTGPIYDDNTYGQRFIPSREFRCPIKEEYYLYKSKVMRVNDLSNSNYDYHPILLPVPELEPEHKFQVGDWVKASMGHISQISHFSPGKMNLSDGEFFWMDKTVKAGLVTKLPGRPLTANDLMRVLSGDKVMVECHACGCGEKGGVTAPVRLETNTDNLPVMMGYAKSAHFYHGQEDEPIACFDGNGGIVFANSVEGNIFVIEEDK